MDHQFKELAQAWQNLRDRTLHFSGSIGVANREAIGPGGAQSLEAMEGSGSRPGGLL